MCSLTAHESTEENNREDNAEGSHNNICDSHEVVLATKRIGRAEHERLFTIESSNVVSAINNKLVSALFQVAFNDGV